ncbi:DUF58 domain-containing protein [Comamonas piscis]|uniref:DUF58 domain-containing protein n=2 Tax=Comamonas piscis TaxID=1562974 RepID=A0A7G5ENX0_9BURK|nr:DUF58 domain-containing protein [Comamonas piscis]
MRQWWLAHLPSASSHVVSRRNLYLLPTRAGWMLALTLLLLLVTSINFQLNLGFLLTFMLTGAALVSVGIGYRNLLGLQLELHAPDAQFAGQALRLDLRLDNPSRRARYALGIRHYQGTALSLADVAAQASTQLQLSTTAERRGYQSLPAVLVETRFPLGVFRMWTVFRTTEKALVYPSPETNPPPLPLGLADAGTGSSASLRASSGEFDGVRGYRRGDPLKLVVWKKAATAMATGNGHFVVRDNQHQAQQDLWLDAQHCGLAEREGQLSRLAAWVLMADQQGLRYGLRLGQASPAHAGQPADSGPEHRQACLRALALA